MEARPGDIVSRRKGLVMHRGIVLEDGQVFHNTPFQGEHVSSLHEFRKNKRMFVHEMDAVERLEALRACGGNSDRNYNLFTNNCEHTISRASTGKGRSPQLVSFLISGGVAAATLALTRSPGLALAGFALTRKLTSGKDPL
ncbi:MAG: hypothetical protein OXG24_07765 [Gammaproteobacteria bacterium]|nr:hypothetical protein [Gammaproteobacteria bacterium]